MTVNESFPAVMMLQNNVSTVWQVLLTWWCNDTVWPWRKGLVHPGRTFRSESIKTCVSWSGLNAEFTHSYCTHKPNINCFKMDFWPEEKGDKITSFWEKLLSSPLTLDWRHFPNMLNFSCPPRVASGWCSLSCVCWLGRWSDDGPHVTVKRSLTDACARRRKSSFTSQTIVRGSTFV